MIFSQIAKVLFYARIIRDFFRKVKAVLPEAVEGRDTVQIFYFYLK